MIEHITNARTGQIEGLLKETRYKNYLVFTLLPTYNQPRQFYRHLSWNLAGHGRVLEYSYSDRLGPSAPVEHTAGKGLENSCTFDAWVSELRYLDRSVVPEFLKIYLVLPLLQIRY